MKTLIAIIAAASIAACSTYSETQARAPMVEVSTAKTVDAYLGCVTPMFAEFWQVAVLPDGDARILTASGGGASKIIATITVTPTDSGSTVAYRQMHDATGRGFGKYQDKVRTCASE